MSTGFKKATVAAASVPATQTNFPAYVDLSRLGITTLAEAQSVRVYAEAAKTTEWAREIVSATEMHVKVPSLTATTEIYVDWDGVTSDYAVTDTYGRNAVWTGYDVVAHGDGATDSTGRRTLLNNGAVEFLTTDAQIGKGYQMDNISSTTQHIGIPNDASTDYTGDMYVSAWLKRTATDRDSLIASGGWIVSTGYWINVDEAGAWAINKPGVGYASTIVATGLPYTTKGHFVFKKTASTNVKIYNNGTLHTTTTGAGVTGNFTVNNNIARLGGRYDYADSNWNGTIDEYRSSHTLYSDEWITTEYNNQSDESTFWGTWSDAGGAPTYRFNPQIRPFAGL